MGPLEYFIIIILGIGIGFLASMFGIGGGFLLMPTMIILLGLETHETVGTSAFIIMFMSISSTIAYARQRRIDYRVGLILMTFNVIGSILGALFVELVSGQFIKVMFGVVEATLATILGLKKTPQEKTMEAEINEKVVVPEVKQKVWYKIERNWKDKEGYEFHYTANLLLSIPFIFLAGFLSSLLGIGGGTLYIQVFVFFCGMPIHMAIASSMFMIFSSAAFSTVTFAITGRINYLIGSAYVIGMVIGAQTGAPINKRINAPLLKKLAALMILIIAIRMIIFALVENPG